MYTTLALMALAYAAGLATMYYGTHPTDRASLFSRVRGWFKHDPAT